MEICDFQEEEIVAQEQKFRLLSAQFAARTFHDATDVPLTGSYREQEKVDL